MPTQFDLNYEQFKKSLPRDLTPKQYEEAIRNWLSKKEKNERVDTTS